MAHPSLLQRLLHERFSCRIKAIFSTLGVTALGLLMSLPCQATGFGAPRGEVLIGAPLSLEIEVLNPERTELECYEIKPPSEEGESSFFPSRAHLDLRKSLDGKTFLILTGEAVQEPIVEFRLGTRCGTQVERRYTLLAEPPPELIPATVALPVAPSPQPSPAPPMPSESRVSQTASGLTLDQLARQRYPLQPKAREKFKRLIKEANPDLSLADDEALPVPPDALKYPENLPKRRTGPYRPIRSKATRPATKPPAPAARTTAPAPSPSAPPTQAAAPQSDRLVIAPSAGEKAQSTASQESALTEKAESSFAMQEEMISRLAQAELAYKSLQERLQLMENRMRTLEMEKERLQREQEALSQSALVELIISVLVGGALGALLMSFWLRRRAANAAPFSGL